jgi:hypothetical protein
LFVYSQDNLRTGLETKAVNLDKKPFGRFSSYFVPGDEYRLMEEAEEKHRDQK